MDSVQVKITIGEKTAKAILYNHPTCKDFASLLPLTLKLEDYNKLEKISLLSQKISSENAPSGFDPPVANLTYYEPWGNLSLFYKDEGYANALISMGKITSGLEVFTVSRTVTAKLK